MCNCKILFSINLKKYKSNTQIIWVKLHRSLMLNPIYVYVYWIRIRLEWNRFLTNSKEKSNKILQLHIWGKYYCVRFFFGICWESMPFCSNSNPLNINGNGVLHQLLPMPIQDWICSFSNESKINSNLM